MTYDANKPADDGYLTQAPAEIRENLRALKEDEIVDAAKVQGRTASELKGRCNVFSTVGTSVWTCPDGVTKVYVTAIGAGGGGGGSGDDTTYSGTGGGSGSLIMKKEITVSPGTDYTVIVGAGGSAGSNGGAGVDGGDGGSGNETYFKDGSTVLVEASGGKKGAGASSTANAASRMVDVLVQGSPSPIGANDFGIFNDASLSAVLGCFGGGGMAGSATVTVSYRSGATIGLGGSQPGKSGLVILEY